MVKLPVSKITKVNLAWGGIVLGGIALFVAAKYSVDSNRHEMMRMKRRIKEQVQQEANQEASLRDKNT